MFETKQFRLGKREAEIMTIVWNLGEATVQEVCERLGRSRYTTVQTMMRTLESKGLLDHRVFGRTFIFRALVSREQVRISKLCELRDALFGGSTTQVFMTMLSHSSMKPAELTELRRLLKEADTEENHHA
jgi:predicted transcriptional regulator